MFQSGFLHAQFTLSHILQIRIWKWEHMQMCLQCEHNLCVNSMNNKITNIMVYSNLIVIWTFLTCVFFLCMEVWHEEFSQYMQLNLFVVVKWLMCRLIFFFYISCFLRLNYSKQRIILDWTIVAGYLFISQPPWIPK